MRKYDYFWASNKDWYEVTEFCDRVIKPDAPPEAQESWKRYCAQKEKAQEDIRKGISCD